MKKGLLWYDGSERALSEKIGRAARRYKTKFGAPPDACYVHPSALEGNGKVREVNGVSVTPLSSVLQNHFWLGREENPRSRRKTVTR